jgi:hypothetical protein
MLWVLFIIVMTLWLAGALSSHAVGGVVQILLVLAMVALAFQLITARHPG